MSDTKALEILAKLSGTNIPIKAVIQDWILITYDLPNNKEGSKTRYEFLKKAREIGAVPHTESVWLLPLTPESQVMALEIAKKGKAVVWTSTTAETGKSEEITKRYDDGIMPAVKEVEKRIDKIAVHLKDRKFKLAEKMSDKTERMINNLEQAIIRRGSQELYIFVLLLKMRFNSIFGRI